MWAPFLASGWAANGSVRLSSVSASLAINPWEAVGMGGGLG